MDPSPSTGFPNRRQAAEAVYQFGSRRDSHTDGGAAETDTLIDGGGQDLGDLTGRVEARSCQAEPAPDNRPMYSFNRRCQTLCRHVDQVANGAPIIEVPAFA